MINTSISEQQTRPPKTYCWASSSQLQGSWSPQVARYSVQSSWEEFSGSLRTEDYTLRGSDHPENLQPFRHESGKQSFKWHSALSRKRKVPGNNWSGSQWNGNMNRLRLQKLTTMTTLTRMTEVIFFSEQFWNFLRIYWTPHLEKILSNIKD